MLKFDSKASLTDYDAVLFAPSFLSINNPRTHQGLLLLDGDSSRRIMQIFSHWNSELTTILQNGKTVFFILNHKIDFYITNSSSNFEKKSTYDVLPIHLNNIKEVSGSEVLFISHPVFKRFSELFLGYLSYEVYFHKASHLIPLFVSKDSSRILGGISEIYNGKVVLIPNIDSNKLFHSEIFGSPPLQNKEFGESLFQNLLEIDRNLSTAPKTAPPPWLEDKLYATSKLLKIKDDIEDTNQTIVTLEKKRNDLNHDLEEESNIQGLLYEQGKPLENAVIKAMRLLGCTAENFREGSTEFDQIILSPEHNCYIGECEGKDKNAIDITKFRQLKDCLSDYFEREETTHQANGILFGNPQRLMKPEERTLDFTDKCKTAAERDKIALIKTPDLYRVAQYLSDHNDEEFKEKCRHAIQENLGKIVSFPKIP